MFHAKQTQSGSRDAGIRMVYFRQDGSPILDMTDAEWLAAANRTVTMTVTVEAAEEPDVEVTATTRCVAGKVSVVGSVHNVGDESVSVLAESDYGSKQISALVAGKSTSVAFSSRLANVAAGSVTATVDGEEYTASYAAATCR